MARKLTMKRSNSITFERGCEEYINNCRARNLREGTLKHYRESIKSIYRFIEPQTPLENLGKDTIDKFVVECKTNTEMNDMTLYTYARDLKTLMYFFMRSEYIPTFKLSLPKADKQQIDCYTDSELKALLKKPDLKKCSFSEYKAWVMINFLLSTGIRQNSLVNIKIKDIDFDNEVVHIKVTKNRKPLIIPLNRTIIKILKDYLNIRQHETEDDFLFCNVFGKQLIKSTVYRSISDYHKDRGVDKTGMHRYRHTFAKKFVTNGGSVVTLQKVLGHSSLDITQNYLNVLTTDLKRDMEKIDIISEFEKEYIKLKK